MKFIADLHIHSKFSRATAKNLDLENLYIAAQLKGITVVGTGDFTHPGWFSEIEKKLEPAEEGLFRLKSSLRKDCDKTIPKSCRNPVRFMLTTEISNIYKKEEKTRKNHNLVFMQDLDSAKKFNDKLDKIGNIKSDGRPILGLDARDLLEIMLETSQEAFLVPAHIWTPWFSMLGSKSGFDSVKECFEDLSDHIFAVETGLSSDPAMNRRVPFLDGLTLISNSDAHSPMKLGRESNVLDTELSFSAIKSAIKTADPKRFLGTYEFYPEEGKYHVDGHRKCNVCLFPEESRKYDGICPVCGKKLTLGVLNRVETLSKRPENFKPENSTPYNSLIPLDDILSELLKVGPKSKTVMKTYHRLIDMIGPEFTILNESDKETLDRTGVPLLWEAIIRMRENRVKFSPGFDGEFGKVKLFSQDERESLLGMRKLFNIKSPGHQKRGRKIINKEKVKPERKNSHPIKNKIVLNKEQKKVVAHENGPILISAGPGTGKTRTITKRIEKLIKKSILPHHILALTFTNKAAEEMKARLSPGAGKLKTSPFIGTFHALCLSILKETDRSLPVSVIDEDKQDLFLKDAVDFVKNEGNSKLDIPLRTIKKYIASAKQQLIPSSGSMGKICEKEKIEIISNSYKKYKDILSFQGLYDFEDLIAETCHLFETNKDVAKKYRHMFTHVFVDEFQDINMAQYQLIKYLSPADGNICVIGDPDQSIYGFRGSDSRYFRQFKKDFTGVSHYFLTRNYRSTKTILASSIQVIEKNKDRSGDQRATYSTISGTKAIQVNTAANDKQEAVFIGKTIESMVGGIGFHSIDFGKTDDESDSKQMSFSDFAVLFRTHDQAVIIADQFEKAGIPFKLATRKKSLGTRGIKALISLFNVVEDMGSIADFENIIKFMGTGVGSSTLNCFKQWSYKMRLPLKEAIVRAKRVPVPGMGKEKQKDMFEFFNTLDQFKTFVSGNTVRKKIEFLLNEINSRLDDDKDPNFIETTERLLFLADQYTTDSSGFSSAVSLYNETDLYDAKVEKVTLMTMHASKGLEFPVVFISGCETGFLPMIRLDEPLDLNEERRLFYVAMTRAEQRLFLTWAKRRKIFGKLEKRQVSSFIEDIDNILKEMITAGSREKRQVQLSLF